MISIEIRAMSYEKAMELAVSKTGKSLDELTIKCIREPIRILFMKGVYQVTIDKDENLEKKLAQNSNKPEKKPFVKPKKPLIENKTSEVKDTKNNNQPKPNDKQKTNNKPNTQQNKPNNTSVKNTNQNTNTKPQQNNQNLTNKSNNNKKEETLEASKPIIATEKEETKTVIHDDPVIQINEETKIVTDTVNETMPTKEVNSAELDHFVRNYLVEFAKVQGVDVEVEVQIRDGNKFYVLIGDNAHKLIGYHGENLNAMQFIVGAVVNEKFSASTRILLDIEKYKEKREESLKALARKTARKVFQTKRSQKLEPMNANERRIIHSELQSNQKITTESHGTEPYRYVVIKLK